MSIIKFSYCFINHYRHRVEKKATKVHKMRYATGFMRNKFSFTFDIVTPLSIVWWTINFVTCRNTVITMEQENPENSHNIICRSHKILCRIFLGGTTYYLEGTIFVSCGNDIESWANKMCILCKRNSIMRERETYHVGTT